MLHPQNNLRFSPGQPSFLSRFGTRFSPNNPNQTHPDPTKNAPHAPKIDFYPVKPKSLISEQTHLQPIAPKRRQSASFTTGMWRYNAAMETDRLDSPQTLREAHRKAGALVENLRNQMAELEANPPDLAAEQLAQGLKAMQGALDSAQRVSRSLEEALKVAPVSPD
jgi:hypothetical protein